MLITDLIRVDAVSLQYLALVIGVGKVCECLFKLLDHTFPYAPSLVLQDV